MFIVVCYVSAEVDGSGMEVLTDGGSSSNQLIDTDQSESELLRNTDIEIRQQENLAATEVDDSGQKSDKGMICSFLVWILVNCCLYHPRKRNI